MAQYVATDHSFTFNSVDLSTKMTKLTIEYSANALADTAMGDTNESVAGGLKKWSIDAEFIQDHTGSSVDATLFPLVGSTAAFIVKPTSSAVSATNPQFTGTALLVDYKIFDNEVGDLAKVVAHFENAGTLTRATT